MAIEDFDFKAYDSETLEHLERHLDGSATQGSHFNKGAFGSAREVVEYALDHIRDYEGQVLVRTVNAGREVGEDALVSLENLPAEARVTQEPRGKDGYLVNVVEGIGKTPTRDITIIAGPLDETTHGFYTIYPGQSALPFPLTEEQLTEQGLEGNALEEATKANGNHRNYWEGHGFVKD